MRNMKINISSNGSCKSIKWHHEKLYIPFHGNTIEGVSPLNLWISDKWNGLNLEPLGGGDQTQCATLRKRCQRPSKIMGWFNVERAMPLNSNMHMISTKSNENLKSCLRWWWKNYLHVIFLICYSKVICSFIWKLLKRGGCKAFLCYFQMCLEWEQPWIVCSYSF